MGDDEYHPLSQLGTNLSEAGGIGYTVVDSIDTMLLMGLHDEHARAKAWVANKMSLDRDDNFNTFEVSPLLLCPQPAHPQPYSDRRLFVFWEAFFQHTISLPKTPFIWKRQSSSPIESYLPSNRPLDCPIR